MRNTLLLVFITVLQAYANDTYSQNTKLTLSLNNVTVANVLEEIQNNSEFYFLFNAKLIDVERKVSISMEDKKISEILTFLLSGTGVNYMVYDRQIILTPSDLTSLSAAMQQLKITGTVVDKNGSPVPGVNVVVTGTTQGTITDIAGKYSIEVPQEAKSLTFTFVGMEPQEITIGTSTQINVTMADSAIGLEEVVVIGYGTQKKINLTGAVSQVNSEKLENRSVPNINAALEGLAPGLNITPSNLYGGEPGAAMNFNIRGIGSLSGGSPYVLVDGVAMDMNKVNPNDVENISILKDAASAAIYGAKATFGVILITTKMGKKNEKLKAKYSNYVMWSAPTKVPGFVNSLDFANKYNEASVNAGQANLFKDEVIERIKKYQADPEHFPSLVPDPGWDNHWAYWELANGNTDWYDVYYKDWTFSQNHNLSISGGSENVTYYLGFGYLDEDGKFNYADDKYQRYNITSSVSSTVTDWMTVRLNARFSYSYFNYPKGTEGWDRTIVPRMFARQWPTEPLTTPNGDLSLNLSQVPNLANGGSDERWDSDIYLTPSIEFRLTKDWKINTDFSYAINNSKQSDFTAIITGLAVDGTPAVHYADNYNEIKEILSNQEYLTSNVYSTFEKKLNNHFISILLGGQTELNKYFSLYGLKRDLVAESVPSISTATGDEILDDELSHWATAGVFMRFLYNYSEKYLVEFNGRYDGSSRFQSGKRWGFFPSASIGYVISKENFWEPLRNRVNVLKLRASYGSLGNQNVANYLFADILPIETNLSWIMDGKRPIYTRTPSLKSSGLTWETARTSDFGLDVACLDSRLNLSFDLYKRVTENMFGPGVTLPALLGADVPKKNNATLETKGFELSIGWKQTVNNVFRYDLSLLLADSKSVVTDYNNPTGYMGGAYTGNWWDIVYYKGQVLGDIWGYESHDLFQSDEEAQAWVDQTLFYPKWGAGDVKYIDQDGDKKITYGNQTLDDHGDLKVIGNTSPRYTYGANVNIYYKGFGLNMFWQGVGKRNVWMTDFPFWGFVGIQYMSSLQTHNADFWSPNNTDAYFPKPYMSYEVLKNQVTQSRYLQDASYIRLKNLTFSYTLPSEIVSKIKMSEVQLYLTGVNILTFSPIIDPFDPEATEGAWGSGMAYPLSKSFSFGVNVTF